MALSIEEILGFVPLTKAIETVKSGVPRVLPPSFYARNPAFRLMGDKTRRIETAGTRRNARLVPYGAPGRQVTQLPLSGRDVQLLHTEERLEFSHELFLQVREFESYTVQQKFAEEARRQVMAMTTRMVNLESSAVHSMLATGALNFDSDGMLLPSSSGADLTIDYAIPANNKNQLNGIIDASWATTSTNIPLHIKKIKRAARQTAGYPLKYALYGENVMPYLLKNTFLQSYLVSLGGDKLAKQFLESGELPESFMGLQWISMNETFWDTETGTATATWDADTVMFCPDPADPNVYGIYEGSHPVLKKFDITSDAMGQFANWDHEYGRYGYGRPQFDPLGIIGVYGDTFLPSLHNPAAYFLCDTTP